MPRVTVEIDESHVAHVTLTRGDKMNAVDAALLDELIAAGETVAASTARAVVLSGEGRAFCAGLDVASFGATMATDKENLVMTRTHGDANRFQKVALIWHDLAVPVIAALHGVCFGAGFQIASGADIRIASPDTRLSIMEMKWGLVPDMGGMVLWPHYVRSDVLKRLTYTADEIGAAQARDWSLVTELSGDPLQAARDLATSIATRSPSAVRAAKRLITIAESGAPRADVLMAESREQTDLIGGPEQMEQIAANLQKRVAKFS